ncbi:uncharacterized protein LOC135091220 [Scylla paramamosain]|uniref:uncharacterized protein LOC135091220 n=1 Tax=Scylla paramamosain TaxID=85552 RepID=UPI003083D659
MPLSGLPGRSSLTCFTWYLIDGTRAARRQPQPPATGTFNAYYRRGGEGVPIVSRRATYALQSRSGVRGSNYHMHFGKRGDHSCLRRYEESSGKGVRLPPSLSLTMPASPPSPPTPHSSLARTHRRNGPTRTSWSSGGQARAKADGDRFVTQNNSIVTAQVGASVILHCKTSSATGGLVSWIRKRDYQLLTVGLHTHSSDDRFSINYVHWDWQLHIRYVQPRDAGLYECQVSSHPPTSLFVRLQVVEAEAEILGAPEKHVKLGSILRLVCIMHHTTEALSYVFWYRGNEMINYESEEGTGSVVVESDDHTSVLIVASATRLHSGNYTCAPSNTKPASILVHVLNGEYPAAMQHGESSCRGLEPPSLGSLVSLALLLQIAVALTGARVPSNRATAAGSRKQSALDEPNAASSLPRPVTSRGCSGRATSGKEDGARPWAGTAAWRPDTWRPVYPGGGPRSGAPRIW